MLTLDALREYGANVEEGLGRCVNNEGFYFRMVKMALEDQSFRKLKDAVAAGDLDTAFEAAHALKGVMGNLALTPIFTPASEATELLRARTRTDYTPYVQQMEEQLEKLRRICAD